MSTGTLERETVQVPTQVPAEGTVTISLAQVDDTRYPNYRKQARETHLMDLFGKIKEHKQLTPCVGVWTKEGKVAIIAGWCRLEAIRRIALEKVVREYNTANNLETTSPGFISLGGDGFESHKNREKIREAGGEWAEKYNAALAGAMILFRTVVVENDADAALKSIVENTYDKPPLMDLCDRIEQLLTDHKDLTQKAVAKALKMSEPAISQHRKIKACPEWLRQQFAGDLTELVKKGEDQETKRAALLTAVAELERRLAMEQEVAVPGGGTKPNEQFISFSHARDFSGAVMNAKEPMTLAGIQKALFDLVGMQENGKLSDSYVTPDYGVYKSKLNEAKRIGKQAETPVVPAADATGAAATTTTTPATDQGGATNAPVSNIPADVSAAFDKAGEHLEQKAPAPVSTGNQPATTAAPTEPKTPTVPTGQVSAQSPQLSPEEQAKMAEIEAANAPASDKIDDLLAGEGDGTPVGGAVLPTQDASGQMKSKTTDAPVPEKYKNRKTPEKVENMANKMLDYATDERVSTAGQIGYLLASAQLFNTVGMEDAEMIVNEQFVTLDEAFKKYIATLEATVIECKGEGVLNEIKATLPKFVRPQLAK